MGRVCAWCGSLLKGWGASKAPIAQPICAGCMQELESSLAGAGVGACPPPCSCATTSTGKQATKAAKAAAATPLERITLYSPQRRTSPEATGVRNDDEGTLGVISPGRARGSASLSLQTLTRRCSSRNFSV